LATAVADRLRRAVPFEGLCLLTVDPATLLPTFEVVEDALPPGAMRRLGEIEIREPDVNKFVDLAHAEPVAASLSAATAGDLDQSLRQREVRRPNGFEDELRSVLTGPGGTWGALTLLREAHRPHFTPAEVAFVASLADAVADGLRRAALLDAGSTGEEGVGLVVLADDDTVELADEAGARWLDELEPGPTGLPIVVQSVGDQTRAAATGASDVLARARVRTMSGQWLVVRGSQLGDRIVVVLEPARAAELAPLLVDAYGLTDRERTVTELVAQGRSTTEIADRLHLSAYTVQDHLKSIFDKSGTGTRGELVAQLFVDRHALDDPPAS
jgi:DNA-binding CsgD family transcriptional regulator